MVTTQTLTRQEAEDFLFEEARLIDERQLDKWLTLFSENAIYWIPIDEESDPAQETSILYDDDILREIRIHAMSHERNFAQMPRSRTAHVISNVQVWPGDAVNEAKVRCNMVVHEIRGGDHSQLGLGNQRALAGHCDYVLRYNDGWKIVLKKVVLINRHMPISNLSFIL